MRYPGDTWIYRNEDGQRGAQRYDKVTEDGLLRGRGPKAHAEYYFDHAHTVRKVYSNGRWLTRETRDFPEIGRADLDFPLVLRKTWSVTMRDPSFGLVIVGHYRVARCEQVTVPAGTFLAARIEVSRMYPATRPSRRRATRCGTPPRSSFG